MAMGQGDQVESKAINFNLSSSYSGMSTPQTDAHRFYKAQESFVRYAAMEDVPTKLEVASWSLYCLSSHFAPVFLIPVLFPLLLTQTVHLSSTYNNDWNHTFPNNTCSNSTITLYEQLVHSSVKIGTINLSPLVFAGCVWAVTMAVLAPILPSLAPFIDYGETQKTFLAISSTIGVVACLPAGVSTNTTAVAIFLAIAIMGTSISSMAQNRHLALMIRGASDPFYYKPIAIASPDTHFAKRQLTATQISLQATMAEGIGAAAMAALTYYLMGISSQVRLGLWISCIFGGIKWAVGTCQAYFLLLKRRGPHEKFSPKRGWIDTFEIRKFPHAITSIATIFLGSLVSSCTFISALLHAYGHRCFEPKNILFMWLAYFLTSTAFAPVVGLVRRVLMADGRQMQVLGFVLTCGVSALGFIQKNWRPWWTIVGAAVQGLGVGILSSYGRTSFLDFTPPGKEGAFLAWFSFVKGCGLCAGFLMASARAWDIRKSLGGSFIASCAALMLLFFGNVGNFSGFLNAGHCKDMISSQKREEEKTNLSANVPVDEKFSGEDQVVELEPDSSVGPSEKRYVVDLPAEK